MGKSLAVDILPAEPRQQVVYINGHANHKQSDLIPAEPDFSIITAILSTSDSWPSDLIEAFDRPSGPYSMDDINVEEIVSEESVELYNGWLVQQEMTNSLERRAVANITDVLSISARNMGFGQMLPDQMECLLSNKMVIKPDVCLISWQRFDNEVIPYGPRNRPTLIGCPELVVESRSPSNRRKAEKRKRASYFANRTQIVWDVDAEKKEIWVYYAHSPDKPLHFGMKDEIHCEPLLPGWRRRIADIFSEHISAEVAAGEVAQQWRAESKAEGIGIGVEIGKVEGIGIGVEIGKVEGIEIGMLQALQSVMPMLINARYGVGITADLQTRLTRCNLAQLQQLQSAVAIYATFDQWLELVPA